MQKTAPDLETPILTVSEFTKAIKLQLETSFPLIYLQGEVSNFKKQSSGHLYFSLKDADAQISCVMFRMQALKLKNLPKEGDQVLIKGELNVYLPRGNYQIIVQELSFIGIGALLQELDERKKKLHALGWFDPIHKKTLPFFPQRIGVITSPTGAVIQDIIHVLTRRQKNFDLLLYPVKVQGEGAKEEIAAAIDEMNKYNLVDVLIVARGGGSIEDLWAFNEEVVAKSVFKSKIPIVSAVGHETDYCLIDFISDVRAPTPSAAAELVSIDQREQKIFLQRLKKTLLEKIFLLFSHGKQRIKSILRHPFLFSPHRLLSEKMLMMDELKNKKEQTFFQFFQERKWKLKILTNEILAKNPMLFLKTSKITLKNIEKSVQHSIKETLRQKKMELKSLSSILSALNPKNILKKGYSILFSKKGGFVVKSVRELKNNQEAFLSLADGDVNIEIKGINTSE